ncbi:uncharacterized protein LOC126555058 [Aphis gossypii]|uniref:uncharacterized protein LOC126555058 n=1 Tax=Aphis gossypii TaxID=80765 RepID=UPI0021590642|nr:uncharacterized protein LOC126555058 [Aphis gossypii]
MKKLIDIIITIAKGGRALGVHDENSKSLEKGLFLEIVELISRYDPVMKDHLENAPKNSTYLSPDIQNDIIKSIQNVMLRSIISSIKCKPVSIIADETTDLGHNEQLSLVIRYFDEDTYMPVERFIGLHRVEKVDSQSIFDELSKMLSSLTIEWNDITSVCFDGAAAMSVLVDACTSSKENRIVFEFFGVVQLTYAFIEGSAVRHAILENISKQINVTLRTMKSLSTTRWACRSEAVSAIKHNYLALIKALENITYSTKQTDVNAKGRGLLYQLKNFNFILGLYMMDPILTMINKVSKYLQSENCDLLSAMNYIKSLRSAINDMRSECNFKCIYDLTVSMCTNLDVTIPKPKKREIALRIDNGGSNQFFPDTNEQELRLGSFYPMLDIIMNGLDERFNQDTINIISSIDKLLNLDITNTDLNILSNHFKCVACQYQI